MRKFSGMKTKIKDRVIRNLAAIAAVAALFFLQGCGKEEVYFSVQDAALLGNVYLYQEIAENGTTKGSPLRSWAGAGGRWSLLYCFHP